MPVPTKQDIKHYRGDTLGVLLRLWNDDDRTDPSDLTGATVTAQVRAAVNATAVLAAFAVTVDDNQIMLYLSPAQTRTLPISAVYDCQIDWNSDDTNVQTVVSGALTVQPDVTRAGA